MKFDIGSYVHILDRRGTIHVPMDRPVKILEISAFKVKFCDIMDIPVQVEKWGSCKITDLSPIPLTENWLTDFGFELKKVSQFQNINLPYWVENGVCLFFNSSPPKNTYLIGTGFNHLNKYYADTRYWIDSVHELQMFFEHATREKLTLTDK